LIEAVSPPSWSLDSLSITWELVRSASSDILRQKLWRWVPAICVLTRASGDSEAHSRARPAGLGEAKRCCRIPYHWFSDVAALWNYLGGFRNWVTFPEILIELVWDMG